MVRRASSCLLLGASLLLAACGGSSKPAAPRLDGQWDVTVRYGPNQNISPSGQPKASIAHRRYSFVPACRKAACPVLMREQYSGGVRHYRLRRVGDRYVATKTYTATGHCNGVTTPAAYRVTTRVTVSVIGRRKVAGRLEATRIAGRFQDRAVQQRGPCSLPPTSDVVTFSGERAPGGGGPAMSASA